MKYIGYLLILLTIATFFLDGLNDINSYVTYEMIIISYVIFVPILSFFSYKEYLNTKEIKPVLKRENKPEESVKEFSIWENLLMIMSVPFVIFLLFQSPFIKIYTYYLGDNVLYYATVDDIEYVRSSKGRDHYYVYIHSSEYGNEVLDSGKIYNRVKINQRLKIKKRESKLGYSIDYNDVYIDSSQNLRSGQSYELLTDPRKLTIY